MPVSLSIKNVPDDIAQRLRERAKRNHRSLQGELLAILEEGAEKRAIPVEEALRQIRASGLKTPDEATAIIREDRDTDHGRVQRDTAMRDQKEVQAPASTITVKELSEWVKARGFTTRSDSVQILREERDAR